MSNSLFDVLPFMAVIFEEEGNVSFSTMNLHGYERRSRIVFFVTEKEPNIQLNFHKFNKVNIYENCFQLLFWNFTRNSTVCRYQNLLTCWRILRIFTAWKRK